MASMDAGVYQAKITPFDFSNCGPLVLQLLESFSNNTAVTFVVQEQHVPAYDPTSVISTQYIRDDSTNRMELSGVIQLSSSLSVNTYYHDWYRNGIRTSDGSMYNSTATTWERLSLQITYNDTADIIGDYIA